MSYYQVGFIRPDSFQISIYNSAATIFLYDEANMAVIQQANPSLLHGYYAIPEKDIDPPLLSLGKIGALLVFELYQDDELQAELSLGQPLNPSESIATWSKPQKGWLSLPSGILCIESLDCLRLGEDIPSEVGARLTLPKGNYELSLQCLSREYEQAHDHLIPEYFISLRPLNPEHPQLDGSPFLPYPVDFR